MPQLTAAERHSIDVTIRRKGNGKDAISKINACRQKQNIKKISPSAVYDYLRGGTHVVGRKDKRGQKKILKPRHVKKIMTKRRQLIKKANNEPRTKLVAEMVGVGALLLGEQAFRFQVAHGQI